VENQWLQCDKPTLAGQSCFDGPCQMFLIVLNYSFLTSTNFTFMRIEFCLLRIEVCLLTLLFCFSVNSDNFELDYPHHKRHKIHGHFFLQRVFLYFCAIIHLSGRLSAVTERPLTDARTTEYGKRTTLSGVQAFHSIHFNKILKASAKDNAQCMQSDSTGQESAKSPLPSENTQKPTLGTSTAVQFVIRRLISFFKSNGKLHFGSNWPVG
jgi:hypothetical protein